MIRREEMGVWTVFHCWKIYTPMHPNDTGYRTFLQLIHPGNSYYVMCCFCGVVEREELGTKSKLTI